MAARLPTLREVVALALEEARRLGAEAAEAAASEERGLSVTVRLGELETLEHHRDRGLGVTVYAGGSRASASTTDLAPEAVRETVAAALSAARHTARDPCARLADPELLAREVPDLDLFHPWELTPEQAVEQALACEAAGRGEDRRIVNSEGATLSTHSGARAYGNSHGFLEGYCSSRHSLSCVLIADDGRGMQRDYWYTTCRDPGELEAPERVGREAARRALRRLGARQVPTCRVPVVYAAEVAGGLFAHFARAIRGESQYRRASFLLEAAGSPVFPEWLDIREEPHLPRALGSAPFDAEGVATRPRDLVRGGILQGYLLDTYSACRLGLRSTGNAGGVHNLCVAPGELDLEGLLREMGTGLLVTELMGMGVNPVTGDYSRGAAGFWVEGGRIVHPVEEVTVAGRLQDMYRGIRAVGRDVDVRGNYRTGSVLIEAMQVAGS